MITSEFLGWTNPIKQLPSWAAGLDRPERPPDCPSCCRHLPEQGRFHWYQSSICPSLFSKPETVTSSPSLKLFPKQKGNTGFNIYEAAGSWPRTSYFTNPVALSVSPSAEAADGLSPSTMTISKCVLISSCDVAFH